MGTASVVIGENTYRIGAMTEDGFAVVEPRLGFVNNYLLRKVILVSELIDPTIVERPSWEKLRGAFLEDKTLGTMVQIFAIKDSGCGGLLYQCLCLCGEKEEVLTLSGRFVKECLVEV